MSQKISRREFAVKAVVVASGAALLAASSPGQDSKLERKPAVAAVDAELAELDAKLERPLPGRLRGPAKAALKAARNNAKERLKFKLPEGSEPCTSFVPLPPRSMD